MGGEGSIIDRLKQLHLVPLSNSYEYDPCDFLKAKEFQQKRDNADWKKGPMDDLVSILFRYSRHSALLSLLLDSFIMLRATIR